MKVGEIFLRLLIQLSIETAIEFSAIKHWIVGFSPIFVMPLILFSLVVFVPTEFVLRSRNLGYLSFVAIPAVAFLLPSLLVLIAPSMRGVTAIALPWAVLWLVSWPASLLFAKDRPPA